MTKREGAIVSAYTGVLIGKFSDFHKYAEEKLGRPIWTHEMVGKEFWNRLNSASKEDFITIEIV